MLSAMLATSKKKTKNVRRLTRDSVHRTLFQAKKPQIIAVDDDPLFLRVLKQDLEKARYQSRIISDCQEAVKVIEEEWISALYIIDYDLDCSITGIDLCRQIKNISQAPVIMMTGYDDEDTVVRCLQAGADQYITKPYRSRELIARIQAVLRLTQKTEIPGKLLESHHLNLQLRNKTLSFGDHSIFVTDLESALLAVLLANINTPVRRDTLYQAVYGKDPDIFSRTLDVLVARTRKKIQQVSHNHEIQTIRSYGFALINIE